MNVFYDVLTVLCLIGAAIAFRMALELWADKTIADAQRKAESLYRLKGEDE